MPTVIPADGFRYYGKLYNSNHGQPAWMYLFDSGVVWQNDAGQLITGAERPVVPADLANVSNVSISGSGFNFQVSTSTAVTGGQLSILNPLLATSGQIQGGNSLPVNVSGVVQAGISNPIGVTGTRADLAATYLAQGPWSFLNMGGRCANPSGAGSVTGDYNTGSPVMLNFAPNGGLYTNPGCLESGYDSVTAKVEGGNAVPVLITGTVNLAGSNLSFDSSSIVSAQASGNAYAAYISGKMDRVGITGLTLDTSAIVLAQASGNALLQTANQIGSGISGLLGSNLSAAAWVTGQITTTPGGNATATNFGPSGAAPWTNSSYFVGQALAANANRIQLGIQNIHTGLPLYVNMGATAASTGTFSFILAPGAFNAGQTFVNDRYRGAVQVSGGAWVAWEI